MTLIVDVPFSERALTVPEFCFVEHISRSTYYKLKRLGLGPQETRLPVPGNPLVRITPAARADWHQRMDALQTSKRVLLLTKRQRAQRRKAAELAAASPRHISRRHKKQVAR